MGGLKVKSFKYILLSFVFLALLITNNNYAFAQEENNSLQIEEIIVTAQKREQSDQDVLQPQRSEAAPRRCQA